jgi:hypothetical protein
VIRAALLGGLLLAGVAFAHPTAASLGQAHWRPQRQVIEVALRLPTHDVIAALKTPKIDARMLKDWVLRDFVVRGRALRWVGTEGDAADTWVYFEIPATAGEKLHLQHGLLFDLSTLQVNSLTVHVGKEHETLQFTPTTPVQTWRVPGR